MLLDGGEYLEGVEAPWVEQRRAHVADSAPDARLDAARLAFEPRPLRGGGGARRGSALADDPFQESAWRLRMRVAGAVGDEDGVIAAYRRCADALEGLGAAPSDATPRPPAAAAAVMVDGTAPPSSPFRRG